MLGALAKREKMKLLISFFLILLLLSGALYAKDPSEPSPVDDEALDDVIVVMGSVTSFYCVLITAYNAVRLHSGHPTRIGGAVGTLSGLLQTGVGAAIILSDDDNTGWGAGFAAVGIVTTYYSIKNILGVRRKYFEEKGKSLTFMPSMHQDSLGSSFYGFRIEYSF
jgi:hypothetical protein